MLAALAEAARANGRVGPFTVVHEQLTRQDYRALMMLSAGHSAVETAAALELEVPALATRLVQLRQLLGVDSTAAAIRAVLGEDQF